MPKLKGILNLLNSFWLIIIIIKYCFCFLIVIPTAKHQNNFVIFYLIVMTLLGDSYYYLSHFGHLFRHYCSLFTTLFLWEMKKETEARDSRRF